MKTLFFSLLAVLSLSSTLFAQEMTSLNTAIAQSQADLLSSKESGNYLFVLPGSLSSEEVSSNAKYYVHYFTVEYSDKTKEAKIKMISNDEKSRHVIMRFLTACGSRYVKVGDSSMSLEDFFVKYVQ